MTVANPGKLLRQAVRMNARNPDDLFRRAGFDALDFGRYVQKLAGAGIRSKDAAFDPAKSNVRDIMAALPLGAAGLGAAAASYPNPKNPGRMYPAWIFSLMPDHGNTCLGWRRRSVVR